MGSHETVMLIYTKVCVTLHTVSEPNYIKACKQTRYMSPGQKEVCADSLLGGSLVLFTLMEWITLFFGHHRRFGITIHEPTKV